MRTNSNWANVFYMVLLTLAVVFIFDNISNFLRRRLSRTIHDYNRIQAEQD
jgi:phosphonate transport system permease protein